MTERCGLDALLSAGGPVRVALRPCCLAALVGRRPEPAGESGALSGAETAGSPSDSSVAAPAGHVGLAQLTADAGLFCAAAVAELQVTS